MIDITSDDFTPMEKRIYEAIVFEGLDIKGLVNKFVLQRSTITTHLDSICHKKQIWGSNNRTQQLQALFWREYLKVFNCSLCKFNIENKCTNKESYEFKTKCSVDKICVKYQPRPKCYSNQMADCVYGYCKGCQYKHVNFEDKADATIY